MGGRQPHHPRQKKKQQTSKRNDDEAETDAEPAEQLQWSSIKTKAPTMTHPPPSQTAHTREKTPREDTTAKHTVKHPHKHQKPTEAKPSATERRHKPETATAVAEPSVVDIKSDIEKHHKPKENKPGSSVTKRRHESLKTESVTNVAEPSDPTDRESQSSIMSLVQKVASVFSIRIESSTTSIFPTFSFTSHSSKATDEDAEDNRNVWSIEAFKPTADRRFAKKLAHSFNPFMYVAAVFGRFPLTYSARKDGNLVFRFMSTSFAGIMFMTVGILTTFIFMLFFFNIVGLMIKFPRAPDVEDKRSQLVRSEEMAIMKRNLVPLIVFMTNLIHVVLSQAAFFFKREYIARYFGYWGEVVELLRLDVADKLKWQMLSRMIILMLMFILILGMHFSNAFSACNGGAAAIAILLTRCFDPAIHLREDFSNYRYFGGFLFTYIYISSKFYMLYFFYRCRLLKNLFIVWNRRFDICVNGAHGAAKKMVRSTRAYLFKDHIVTLNLIEGANNEFVLILESYLLCAMIAMVVEMYHIFRAVGGSEFDHNRQLDFIVLLTYLIFDFYIFFTATLEGGEIPEQAKVAFDIVKRKGMMINSADQELWFMLSMRVSFGGSAGVQGVGITAGDFVYITKTFILLAVGAMTSHFIIIYQFEMPLQQTVVSDPYFDEIDLTAVVDRVEGTRKFFDL